jgi:hypothetical protein
MNEQMFTAMLAQLSALTKAVTSLRNTIEEIGNINHEDAQDVVSSIDGLSLSVSADPLDDED